MINYYKNLLNEIAVVKAQGPLAQALFLGDAGVFNATADNCHWKRGNDRDACPDPDITIKLYTGGKDKRRTEVIL